MTRTVYVGKIAIGGGNKIAVQSMTNTDSSDFDATFAQIRALSDAGCDIVRLAVCNESDVECSKKLIDRVNVPLVADIQFDYKLAIKCAEIGYSKIRFNPGNIGDESKVKKVIDACKNAHVPIRVGVNAGSLEKEIKNKYGVSATALVSSAMNHVKILEKYGFYDTIISVKASDVSTCVKAYRMLNEECDYPLHIGITESGGGEPALLKSTVGIGSLLLDGIGDTVRVSLSDDPVEEVLAAKKILRACGLITDYCQIVSCPTCSRCKYDLIPIVREMQEYTKDVNKKLKIAIMGCVVNGPGEAEDADFGVAGGADKAVIFEKGKIVKTIHSSEILEELKKRVDKIR